jgi:hypothetical protein
MRTWHVAVLSALAAGCRIYRSCGEATQTMWAHEDGAFVSQWHRYDPLRDPFPPCYVGRDGEVLLFATRLAPASGLFSCVAKPFVWRDDDVVGYAPTSRVADPKTRDGRRWHEYRLLGGARESKRVAQAVARQRW